MVNENNEAMVRSHRFSLLTTILDKMIEKLRPPLSPFQYMMEKMARFRCSASTSLNWGGGGVLLFVIYSVQDCSSDDGKVDLMTNV